MKEERRTDSIRSFLRVLLWLERFVALPWSDLKKLTGLGKATLKRSIDFLKTYTFETGPVVWRDPERKKLAITTEGIKFLKWIRRPHRREASRWKRAIQLAQSDTNQPSTIHATDLRREDSIYVPFTVAWPRGDGSVSTQGVAIIRKAGDLNMEEAEDRIYRIMYFGSHPWLGASIEYHYAQLRRSRTTSSF